MLAVTILGLGLTALITTASRCLAVVRQAKNYETARHLLGRVELENPLQLEEKIQPGSDEGGFGSEYAGFRWRRDIETVGNEEDGLFSVTTRVSWSDRGRASQEEIVTYVYAPEKEEGGTVVSR